MKLFIPGKGEIVLTQHDFVHQGGEGSVFNQGNLAYKVYTNPKNMLPLGKIQDLSALTFPNIIRPQDVLLDAKNSPVGYTMKFIQDAVSLCQLFPRVYRHQHSISVDKIIQLVLRIRATIEHIHTKNILLVDLNELNFLVSKQLKEVYFIDTDSYQTPHFPATALMSSIKDWQTKTFSELSDWFSFAVVTFQLFIGIHPYRGKHPVHGSDLETRMKMSISVFDPDVRIPPVCEPFDSIPETWRDWYRSVFSGERVPPPGSAVAAVQVIKSFKQLSKAEKLEFTLLERFPANILGVFSNAGKIVVCTEDTIHSGTKIALSKNCTAVAFTPGFNLPIAAGTNEDKVWMYDILKDEQISSISPFFAQDLMVYEGRLYLHYGDHILEVQFLSTGKAIITSAKKVGSVLKHATQMFSGVVIQELFSWGQQRSWQYASIFPSPGSCYQIPLPELSCYRVICAKFDSEVLMVIGEKGGIYDRFVFRMNKEYASYDYWCVPDVGNFGLNFVVLDSGICVSLNEEGKLDMFRAKKDDPLRRTIDDSALNNNLQLYKDGTRLLAAHGNMLYQLILN